MRITSELFVAQLVRRVFGASGYAAVLRKGAGAAGALFVVVRGCDGAVRMFGPAAQSLAASGDERYFMREAASDEAAIAARLDREARFDPDVWVVEIEIDRPEDFLTIVEP